MATEPTVLNTELGGFNDSALQGAERVNIDYRMQLIRQRESAAPFLSLMLNINSEPTLTHEFRIFETRPNPQKALLASEGAAGATSTWNVATGKGTYFQLGDILRGKDVTYDSATETQEAIITAITADALSVKANTNTAAAKTLPVIPAGTMIQVWGNSFAQGTLSAKTNATVPLRRAFYTQIFKHSYKVTKTHANNRLYGAPERDRLRGEKEIAHIIDIEKSLLQSDGILDTSGTEPRTTLTGLINQISTNVLEYGSTLTDDLYFDFMTSVHNYRYATDGKLNRRLVIASSKVISDINKIALANRQVMDVTTLYGVDVSKMVWAGRIWDFVEDPILSDFLDGWAIVIQPRYIKLREFRPTVLDANIQPNDADYFLDQFMTELGLEVQLEELHGIIKP
jgi:hypothetical protein